ncbi:flagellar hook-length control protein FliK, partial [Lysobacter sp. A3-1-A15]
PAGDTPTTAQALVQAGLPAAAARATPAFDTLVRDAVAAARADPGIEQTPFAPASTGVSPASLAAVRASPLVQPLPMPADPAAGFDEGLTTRVAWMAEQGIGRAELRVNPDHAGPIEVRLQMEGTRLVAEFSATNADTRQALEAGMHRLREMLGQQGLQLAQSHVGSGGGQGRQGGSNDGMAGGTGQPDGSERTAGDTAPARWLSRGLLDEYA